jgi:outer membrane protein TolC
VERQEREQWKEWLPRPSLYVNLQNSLNDLGDLSGDKLSGALFAPLTIPNPYTQQARAYQNALQTVQARDSVELGRRRLIIQLHRLFFEWEDMVSTEATEQHDDPERMVEAFLRRREAVAADAERRNMLHLQLSNILGMPGVNVVPVPSSAPRIDYSRRIDRLQPGVNHGRLASRLGAYEIQGALLRSRGLKLARWPSVSVNASTPSIYDSRRSGGEWLDSTENIFLFGSVTQSFDLTGRQAFDIRNAEENVDFVRQSLRQRIDADARQWQRLKTRYADLNQKQRLINARLEAIRRRGASASGAGEDLEAARNLIREARAIGRAKRQLDMEIWLWDDDAWK